MDSKIHNLWPVPLYETVIDVKKEWVDLAKSFDYQRTGSDIGDYTKDCYILNKFPELKSNILKHKDYFFYNQLCVDKNLKLELENSWINRHNNGDYSEEHSHVNSMLSGCVYLDVPKNSGDVLFIKPFLYNNLLNNMIEINYEKANTLNCKKFGIKPQNGTLLFFPSWLPHSVEQNKSHEQRFSLAFNFFTRGRFGKMPEGQLVI